MFVFSQNILLKSDYFFDSEQGVFKEDIEILISKNKIVEVGHNLSYDLEKTIVKDLGNATLLPGLIDAHTHLLIEENLHPSYYGFGETVVKNLVNKSDSYRVLEGAKRAGEYLMAGFTSIRDLGNSGAYADVDLRNAIQENLISGPRMNVSGPGVAAIGGQLNEMNFNFNNLAEHEYQIVHNVNEAISAVREHALMKVDVIKIYADNIPNRTMLRIAEIEAIVKEAKRYDLKVTAHAITNQSVWNASQANVHSIEHAYNVADSTLAIVKANNIVLVPTYSNSKISDELFIKFGINDSIRRKAITKRSAKRQQEQLYKLYKSDVRLVYGSDFYSKVSINRGEAAKQGLFAWLEAGIPLTKVLQYSTINAAELIFNNAKTGIIKEGYLADIIAVRGNLSSNNQLLNECAFVMKNGEIVKE